MVHVVAVRHFGSKSARAVCAQNVIYLMDAQVLSLIQKQSKPYNKIFD